MKLRNRGLTEVAECESFTVVVHRGNMGNSINSVRTNVDSIYGEGTMDEMLKLSIREEGSPDYLYELKTAWVV